MATTNNITGDSLITKAPTDAYRANYDAIFKKPKQQEADMHELVKLSEDLDLYEDKSKERCFECTASEGRHKMDCGSKAVFDAYILLRDTDKWKHFTGGMLNTLEFKVWVEQQDRKYSNMFDKEED